MVRPDANENHSVFGWLSKNEPGLWHLPQVYLGSRELEEPRGGQPALQKRGAITVGRPRCAGRWTPTSTVPGVWGVSENCVTSMSVRWAEALRQARGLRALLGPAVGAQAPYALLLLLFGRSEMRARRL